MRIPFGKHKGFSLCDLPEDYLNWLLTIEIREPLRSAIRAEADARRLNAEARDYSSAPYVAVVDELVSAGFKSLAKRLHPDVGGTHEKMIEITHAAEWVKSQVRLLL